MTTLEDIEVTDPLTPRETYTDKSGATIDRETAVREAVRCIIRQGDAEPYVREAVEFFTNDELMEWLVYPDTGEFAFPVPS